MGEGQSKTVGSGLTVSTSPSDGIEKKEFKESMKQFSQGELLLLDSMFRDLAARSPGFLFCCTLPSWPGVVYCLHEQA